jgi:hypothetical protein
VISPSEYRFLLKAMDQHKSTLAKFLHEPESTQNAMENMPCCVLFMNAVALSQPMAWLLAADIKTSHCFVHQSQLSIIRKTEEAWHFDA